MVASLARIGISVTSFPFPSLECIVAIFGTSLSQFIDLFALPEQKEQNNRNRITYSMYKNWKEQHIPENV